MSIKKVQPKVRYLLWAKSAGRCEFDGCNKPLYRDGLTQIEMNFADVAHIIGSRSGGPRGDIVLSEKYCNDVSNLMLMCLEHHRLIDEATEIYSDDVLRQMKRVHEERMERLTAIKPDKTSHVVVYEGIIGEHPPKIDITDAWAAMEPEWYPTGRLPIELGIGRSSIQDNEPDYWQLEATNLERQFVRYVKPLIDSPKERSHFSVFAIGAQPLLVRLGTLFSDIYPAEVYQLHREPTTWKWQPAPEEFEYIVEEPASFPSNVALNLSLSATIDSSRIKLALGDLDYSEWKLTIVSPNNDFLRSKAQLQMFRKVFRQLLDRIKSKHGQDAKLHIFPAVPVSIAVEIGRVWQPKADLPLILYDQNRKLNGFAKALTIGDTK